MLDSQEKIEKRKDKVSLFVLISSVWVEASLNWNFWRWESVARLLRGGQPVYALMKDLF